MTYITKSQLKEIEEACYDSIQEFHNKLAKYTGIVARPCTAYQYFDDAGDFIGDSDDSLEGLLESAYIEVIDDV